MIHFVKSISSKLHVPASICSRILHKRRKQKCRLCINFWRGMYFGSTKWSQGKHSNNVWDSFKITSIVAEKTRIFWWHTMSHFGLLQKFPVEMITIIFPLNYIYIYIYCYITKFGVALRKCLKCSPHLGLVLDLSPEIHPWKKLLFYLQKCVCQNTGYFLQNNFALFSKGSIILYNLCEM